MRGVLPALTLGIEIKSDWRWKLSCKLIHKLKKIKNFCLWPSVLFSFSFFGHTCSTWKFPGQGLNLCHSCDLGCYRDKAGSLTQCQKGTPFFYWLNKSYLLVLIIGAKMYIGMCYYWPAMCFKVLGVLNCFLVKLNPCDCLPLPACIQRCSHTASSQPPTVNMSCG